MTKPDDPINPTDQDLRSGDICIRARVGGLTKREWFAGLVSQGFTSGEIINNAEEVAIESVKYADTLIAELNRKKEE